MGDISSGYFGDAFEYRNLDERDQRICGTVFYLCLRSRFCVSAYYACYAFPALSRFDMSVGWILKISMYMGVRYLLTSLALLTVLACFGIFIWKIPMLMFLVPGPVVFLMSEFLERVLKKHEAKTEEE
mgnify:CR=1 FL=1